MTNEATESTIHVLLIEDDERLAALTARYLELRGLKVTTSPDGLAGLEEARRRAYDLILLDLMLPHRGGLDVCRELRTFSDVPLIMVTALGDEPDRITGLEAGADDYLTKPFSSAELLARVRAQVRRYRGQLGPSSQLLKVGRVEVDPEAMTVTVDGRLLGLTTYEFSIVHALAERAGRVLGREQLLELVKGGAEDALDRTIDGHISRIRKKLGDDPKQPALLKTVRGVGYVLVREG